MLALLSFPDSQQSGDQQQRKASIMTLHAHEADSQHAVIYNQVSIIVRQAKPLFRASDRISTSTTVPGRP